jgi:hypothetical protein
MARRTYFISTATFNNICVNGCQEKTLLLVKFRQQYAAAVAIVYSLRNGAVCLLDTVSMLVVLSISTAVGEV